MGALENLQKLYDKKEAEVHQLEIRLKEASAYLQAIQDSIKVLTRESAGEPVETEQVLRAGTAIATARDVLRASAKPLHINELLRQMGKEPDKKNKLSLSGSIAGYVRDGQIFTRPAPNTFGLIEFGEGQGSETGEVAIPSNFGKMQ